MQHAYFGELDTSDQDGRDVVWEAERTLGDQTIEVLLWADADQALNEADLDAFATLVQDLPALDTKARGFLQAELAQDDSFIRHHTDEVADVPALAAVAPTGEITVADFVRAMRLITIGLWTDQPPSIVLDYQIDPEHSDQILAVKLDAQGALTAVDWES